jgi:FHS family L-fucose permease-like MFS transporter
MLDTLNKHFQDMLQLSKAQSGMIQFSVYMAYFSMALPAGYFMRAFGYKKGIILGLSLFATGALLIAATTSFESFWIFLICLFVMGCGLATLETAANPYTTKLDKGTWGTRLTFRSRSYATGDRTTYRFVYLQGRMPGRTEAKFKFCHT